MTVQGDGAGEDQTSLALFHSGLVVTVGAAEESFHVPRAMYDMNDFHDLARRRGVDITEKDHIAPEGHTAIFGAQFMSRSSQRCGKLREVLAIIRELVDEGQSDFDAFACAFDVAGDLVQITKRARQIDETRHLKRGSGLVPLCRLLPHITAYIRRRMAASLRDGSIERGAQGTRAKLADGIAHGVLRRRKRARSDFGLDPLGDIRCEFDFHDAPAFP